MTDFLKMRKKIIGSRCFVCGKVETDNRLKRWIDLQHLPCDLSYCDGFSVFMFGNPFDVCMRELKILFIYKLQKRY